MIVANNKMVVRLTKNSEKMEYEERPEKGGGGRKLNRRVETERMGESSYNRSYRVRNRIK